MNSFIKTLGVLTLSFSTASLIVACGGDDSKKAKITRNIGANSKVTAANAEIATAGAANFRVSSNEQCTLNIVPTAALDGEVEISMDEVKALTKDYLLKYTHIGAEYKNIDNANAAVNSYIAKIEGNKVVVDDVYQVELKSVVDCQTAQVNSEVLVTEFTAPDSLGSDISSRALQRDHTITIDTEQEKVEAKISEIQSPASLDILFPSSATMKAFKNDEKKTIRIVVEFSTQSTKDVEQGTQNIGVSHVMSLTYIKSDVPADEPGVQVGEEPSSDEGTNTEEPVQTEESSNEEATSAEVSVDESSSNSEDTNTESVVDGEEADVEEGEAEESGASVSSITAG